MRHLTFGAIALTSTLLIAGVSVAADQRSRDEADAEANHEIDSTAFGYQQPLGYAPVTRAEQNDPFSHMRARTYTPPVQREPSDELFLEQGDRGIGNE
ncbi:hypothetical protein V5F32_21835 [Xanthobacter oligotrophicus]|uniref:Hydroxyquinol 1,2-dioxygenase n=1 Tax=Xanthobacter oligotrophicus TaxID=2607286 RepID=A0ABW7A4B9_9HYPH